MNFVKLKKRFLILIPILVVVLEVVTIYLIDNNNLLITFLKFFGFEIDKNFFKEHKELLTYINIQLALLYMVIYILYYKFAKNGFDIIEEKVLNTNFKLKDLLLLSKGNSVFIDPSKHPYIWEGFIGIYYAINSPWLVEEYSDDAYDLMVTKHVKRYENEKFVKSHYIFFTETKYKGSISRFKKFIEAIKSKTELNEKIHIMIFDSKAPNFVLFLGEKEIIPEHNKFILNGRIEDMKKTDYSILYFDNEIFMTAGMPLQALISINSSINNKFNDYAKNLIFNKNSDKVLFDGSAEQFLNKYDNMKNSLKNLI